MNKLSKNNKTASEFNKLNLGCLAYFSRELHLTIQQFMSAGKLQNAITKHMERLVPQKREQAFLFSICPICHIRPIYSIKTLQHYCPYKIIK